MVSKPRKPWQRLALFALVLAALPALADVGTGPIPVFPYSAIGGGSSAWAACAAAIEKVEDHCVTHGSISTTEALCVRPYNPRTGEILPLFCTCTASTPTCSIFGVPHPF